MSRKSPLKLAQALGAFAFVTITMLVSPPKALAQDTVYDFSGNCSDCQNTGAGVLTLQNYTAGTSLNASNFVSFTYTSNLLTFNVTQSELDFNTIGIAGTTPVVSGPSSVGLGLSGALGATAGPADFYFNASVTQGSANYSINFDSCIDNCGSGLTSPGEWQIIPAAEGNSQFPGGLSGHISDYGFGHTWTPVAAEADAVAAPEIDAESAAGAVTLLLTCLAVLHGRRTSGRGARNLEPVA
jgi:hypothetical protein